jgi:hypothetical protein
MSMAKQIYYHNLRKANIKEIELPNTVKNYNIKNKFNVSYGWILILIVLYKLSFLILKVP